MYVLVNQVKTDQSYILLPSLIMSILTDQFNTQCHGMFTLPTWSASIDKWLTFALWNGFRPIQMSKSKYHFQLGKISSCHLVGLKRAQYLRLMLIMFVGCGRESCISLLNSSHSSTIFGHKCMYTCDSQALLCRQEVLKR